MIEEFVQATLERNDLLSNHRSEIKEVVRIILVNRILLDYEKILGLFLLRKLGKELSSVIFWWAQASNSILKAYA